MTAFAFARKDGRIHRSNQTEPRTPDMTQTFPPFDLALGAFSFDEDEADHEGTGFTIARR